MRYGLPGKDAAEVLAFMRKRMPGRKSIEELDRIALLLEDEGDPEDAAILRRLAERLRVLRTAARGQGRSERAEETTREAIVKALEAGLGTPFDEETPKAIVTWAWKEGRKKRLLEVEGSFDPKTNAVWITMPEAIDTRKARDIEYQAAIVYANGDRYTSEIRLGTP